MLLSVMMLVCVTEIHFVLLLFYEGDFLEYFGGCGVWDEEVDDLPMPSVRGEYGDATACAGARRPDWLRGGSECPGHFFCSSCILSSGSPTTWYLAQFTGGHRTIFCGCGIVGNFGAAADALVVAESLRISAPLCPSSTPPAPSESSLVRFASVGVSTSL